ncbi:MAG: hypothetical protein JWO56_2709, partial [Acidobacteria bacterium]|nr:hypothetical protein [Acidobacteriota bacterium]
STTGGTTRVVWQRAQLTLDDERFSMAAVARVAAGTAMIGVGTARGVLMGIDAKSGAIVWQREVGGADPFLSTNHLFSILALDADGNGAPDFVVATESGRLAAFDAATGRLTWQLDFPGHLALGDPIAGDVDGDGVSEILVGAMDGNLYEIRDARPRGRAVRH